MGQEKMEDSVGKENNIIGGLTLLTLLTLQRVERYKA